LFVSISQVIGFEDCLRNDLDYVGQSVKLCSNSRKTIKPVNQSLRGKWRL